MKDHDPRITVTEHSLHHGVRPKSRETVRVMKLKPPSPWRHPRSMPDSPDPATALAPAPTAAGSPFGPSDSPTRFREEPLLITPCCAGPLPQGSSPRSRAPQVGARIAFRMQ